MGELGMLVVKWVAGVLSFFFTSAVIALVVMVMQLKVITVVMSNDVTNMKEEMSRLATKSELIVIDGKTESNKENIEKLRQYIDSKH